MRTSRIAAERATWMPGTQSRGIYSFGMPVRATGKNPWEISWQRLCGPRNVGTICKPVAVRNIPKLNGKRLFGTRPRTFVRACAAALLSRDAKDAAWNFGICCWIPRFFFRQSRPFPFFRGHLFSFQDYGRGFSSFCIIALAMKVRLYEAILSEGMINF